MDATKHIISPALRSIVTEIGLILIQHCMCTCRVPLALVPIAVERLSRLGGGRQVGHVLQVVPCMT